MEEGAFVLMIRFKLGKSKRLAAFACALFLTLELVAFPMTQAKAAATAALTAVGFGVTTAAFLSACGIYPYWLDDSSAVSFDWEKWVDDDLMVLVDEYNAANSTTPINPNQVSAFLSGATLLLGNYAWEKLRDFAEWIKVEYTLTDNQTGAELGDTTFELLPVNRITTLSVAGVKAQGTFAFINSTYSYSRYIGASTDNVFIGLYPQSDNSSTYNLFCASSFAGTMYWNFKNFASDSEHFGTQNLTFNSKYPFYYYSLANFYYAYYGATDIPKFANEAAAAAAFQRGGEFRGMTADTATVSIPAALPEGTEYGGLRVSGLPAATTAESVTDAVQDSVGERLKTPVEVVEVELAPGTEIDSETGAVTQNPVVIEAPVQETIPSLSALAPPQEFIAAMMEALQTKFPFCLPFDFFRVLQAFVKPPDAPVITMEFHDRIGGGTYTITVDLEPWDDIAAIVRRLESMILFLGFWLNFDKFNVLNIILGQIG